MVEWPIVWRRVTDERVDFQEPGMNDEQKARFVDLLRVKTRVMSWEEIARFVGVSVKTLSAWRKGKRFPSKERLIALFYALGISPVGFYGIEAPTGDEVYCTREEACRRTGLTDSEMDLAVEREIFHPEGLNYYFLRAELTQRMAEAEARQCAILELVVVPKVEEINRDLQELFAKANPRYYGC